MSDASATPPGDRDRSRVTVTLAPVGSLGFRGRHATAEERARVFETFFFEGRRRIPYLQQFFTLLVLSAAIAAFGLANDSAAVIIGAMLIAPLMTPIMGTSAAIVQNWWPRAGESLAIVFAGSVAAIAVGIAVGIVDVSLTTGAPLPGEMLSRTSPNLADLGIALAAGAAGAFVTVRTEASSALPGVGISVALVPPLATAGMFLSIGDLHLALGAILLFATNLVAIILAGGLVLTGAGFGAYRDRVGAKRARRATIALVAILGLFVIPLGAHGLQQFERDRLSGAATRAVVEWAPDLQLQALEVDHSTDPAEISVVLTGEQPPGSAGDLAASLADRLDQSVVVDLAFVPITRANAEPQR
jgi:uncharacterized hydrophobic protein (TIGR00271 family)